MLRDISVEFIFSFSFFILGCRLRLLISCFNHKFQGRCDFCLVFMLCLSLCLFIYLYFSSLFSFLSSISFFLVFWGSLLPVSICASLSCVYLLSFLSVYPSLFLSPAFIFFLFCLSIYAFPLWHLPYFLCPFISSSSFLNLKF